MELVSLYNHPHSKIEDVPLQTVLKQIQRCRYGEQIKLLRSVSNIKEGVLIPSYSRSIPMVAVSGVIKGQNMEKFSGFILLQFNCDTVEAKTELKIKATGYPFTYAAYENCLKTGIEVIVRIYKPEENFTEKYRQASVFYSKKLRINADMSYNDSFKKTLISADETIIINNQVEAMRF